jgi:DNA-binding MarR family transcriptional regulator
MSTLTMRVKHPVRDRALTVAGEPVGYLLTRVHRGLRSLLDATLGSEGFTMPQVAVLVALWRTPGVSVAELARRALVTPQTMGEVLVGMEAKGLIVRRAHKSDGRMLPAELTSQGSAALRTSQKHLAAAESRLLSQLSAQQRQQLTQLLKQCLEGLGIDLPASSPIIGPSDSRS